MVRTDQAKLILDVLTSMKDCIDRGSTYTTINGKSFNLNQKNGICWHVFARTPNSVVSGIDEKILMPVFEEMGLYSVYPVEYQISGNDLVASNMYWSQDNRYAMDTEAGKIRYELLCDLIKYFENILVSSEVL